MILPKLPEIFVRTLIRIYQILVYLICISLFVGISIGSFIISVKEFGSGYWLACPVIICSILILAYALARQDVNRFKPHINIVTKKKFNDIK
jgi:hypothetical protein